MRILLSEGGSTSARQAITALGLNGHRVEVCDPDPHGLGRFSRFVSRFHRCPPLGSDPLGYLAFVSDLLATGRFDVLVPIHEQGFLFARVLPALEARVAVALPGFESYARFHSKAGFVGLLSELDLPRPRTWLAEGRGAFLAFDRFPVIVKAAIGTASRSTWTVRSPADREDVARRLDDEGGFDDAVVIQEIASGPLEHAQAVFSRGRVLGFHAHRQVMRGAGGGDAIKESVSRPDVRLHLAAMGERLAWHGALTVDFIWDEDRRLPLYIDGNPRLVEPMGAMLAGNDLMDLLLRVSLGEAPIPETQSRPGVRTHLAIQALFGHVLAGGTRRSLLREGVRLLARRGPYEGSREELTPVGADWLGAVPLGVAAIALLADPRAAHYLPRRRWGAHLLTARSARIVRTLDREADRRPLGPEPA